MAALLPLCNRVLVTLVVAATASLLGPPFVCFLVCFQNRQSRGQVVCEDAAADDDVGGGVGCCAGCCCCGGVLDATNRDLPERLIHVLLPGLDEGGGANASVGY